MLARVLKIGVFQETNSPKGPTKLESVFPSVRKFKVSVFLAQFFSPEEGFSSFHRFQNPEIAKGPVEL